MRIILFICFFIFSFDVFAQETVYPLIYNKNINNVNIEKRSNYVSFLPFFDDFTSFSKSANLWLDNDVYFNNSFCIHPLNYGVATFDGLDSLGNPYNNSVVNLSGIADNLTSVKINLQGLVNVYFSFFYQESVPKREIQNRQNSSFFGLFRKRKLRTGFSRRTRR